MNSILNYNDKLDLSTPKGSFTANGVDGAYIPLGHYKAHVKASPSIHHNNNSIIMHYSQHNSAEGNPKPNIDETRFKRGFYRRQANNIINPVKDHNLAYSSSMTDKQQHHASMRQDFLRNKDTSNGYNLITGETYHNYVPIQPKGRKIISDGMSTYTMKQGKISLRESNARYHAPLGSGPKFEYRQNVLLKEGVFDDRCSSIMSLGKKDLPSYGIEDQFSKCDYYHNNKTSSYPSSSSSTTSYQDGLYEARQAGRYTPKKIPHHASGNDMIVENWTKTIDLNNRSMRGML